jgi:hypothetical protein
MNTKTALITKALESGRLSLLCIFLIALAIVAKPDAAQSTDRLIVTDPTGVNTEFAATDSGTIRLNSNTLPSTVASWALIYGSSTNSNTGYTLDSYGSPVSPATTVTYGGGGAFRFARGTQASPTAVELGDRLGYFAFSGYDGVTGFVNASGFTSKVDGSNVSSGFVPAKLSFETIAQPGETPDDGARVERMVISSKGYVYIGGSGSAGTGIPTTTSYPLQIGNGAYVSAGGQWTNASSRAYKENINTLTTEEANQALDGLSPVKYNYKADKEEKHVGFIAEDVPDLVATKDRKGLSALDIVAVLTKVVQEQKNTIAEQTNMISELSKKVDAMQKEINRVKGMNIVGSIGADIK